VLRDDSEGAVAREAAALAERLALPVLRIAEIAPDDLVLVMGPRGLELRAGDAALRNGAWVDFSARRIPAAGRPRRGHADAGQPLRRALGRRPGFVVDATAGFGDDTIALASWGHRVLAVERSPVVAELLADGLRRALADPALAELAARITLRCADATTALRALECPPDVVYIDPMFAAERTSSALPRKKIQLLRRLVGTDDDAAELVACALASGARRVVVKRSLRAEPLAGRPSASYRGKLIRYDVHVQSRK